MSSIKCGNCGATHTSVSDVRSCFGGRVATTSVQVSAEGVGTATPTAAPVLASEAQHNYIVSLLAKKDLGTEERSGYEALLASGTTTKKQAHAIIDSLKARADKPQEPRRTVAHPSIGNSVKVPSVPAGRYAVKGEDFVVRFYRVDRPTEGKWAGYTFVKVQAGDDLHPLKGQGAAQALAAIAINPQAASRLYGLEIGACGVCGRTLTDEHSRAAGIGPICAAKMEW